MMWGSEVMTAFSDRWSVYGEGLKIKHSTMPMVKPSRAGRTRIAFLDNQNLRYILAVLLE